MCLDKGTLVCRTCFRAVTQFICFTSTKVHMLTSLECRTCVRAVDLPTPFLELGPRGDQCACFTSTKVQILTSEGLCVRAVGSADAFPENGGAHATGGGDLSACGAPRVFVLADNCRDRRLVFFTSSLKICCYHLLLVSLLIALLLYR